MTTRHSLKRLMQVHATAALLAAFTATSAQAACSDPPAPNVVWFACDKSGANLQGANLQRANLRNANLEGANLTWANLQGANLQRAKLGGAKLQGANLTDAILTNRRLCKPPLIGPCR